MTTFIVICYRSGTAGMLGACLSSLERHTPPGMCDVHVLVRRRERDHGLSALKTEFPAVSVEEVPGEPAAPHREHGEMLDWFVPRVIDWARGVSHRAYVLTLDSDCFPVADGWLKDLHGMMKQKGVVTAGILHPWSPPGDSVPKNSLERRIRFQHCWNQVHVACQILRTGEIARLGRYADGDDTGLAINAAISRIGGRAVGFMPTRCPAPRGEADPELNRFCCVVYGDKMVHVGGFTRSPQGTSDDAPYRWAVDRILRERGLSSFWKAPCRTPMRLTARRKFHGTG